MSKSDLLAAYRLRRQRSTSKMKMSQEPLEEVSSLEEPDADIALDSQVQEQLMDTPQERDEAEDVAQQPANKLAKILDKVRRRNMGL